MMPLLLLQAAGANGSSTTQTRAITPDFEDDKRRRQWRILCVRLSVCVCARASERLRNTPLMLQRCVHSLSHRRPARRSARSRAAFHGADHGAISACVGVANCDFEPASRHSDCTLGEENECKKTGQRSVMQHPKPNRPEWHRAGPRRLQHCNLRDARSSIALTIEHFPAT